MDLLKKIRRLTGQAIQDYDMIREGDRILIGVSGGKDSMVLLHILRTLQQKAPVRFELFSVTFDPGFEGFDATGTAAFSKGLGIEHHLIRKDIRKIMAEKDAENKPCVLCSRLRRGSLYALAKELNCNKLALGQHMDDIAVSLMISLCRGKGLSTMGPNIPSDEGSVRVIRPFAYVEERMLKAAAEKLDMPPRGKCIYQEQLEANGDRAYFKARLREMEQHIPGLLPNMLHSMADIRTGYLLDRRFLDLSGKSGPDCSESKIIQG